MNRSSSVKGEFAIGCRIEVKPTAGPRLSGKTGAVIGIGFHPKSLRIVLDRSKSPITLQFTYLVVLNKRPSLTGLSTRPSAPRERAMMNLNAAPHRANPSAHPSLSRSDEFSLSYGIPSAANSAEDCKNAHSLAFLPQSCLSRPSPAEVCPSAFGVRAMGASNTAIRRSSCHSSMSLTSTSC